LAEFVLELLCLLLCATWLGGLPAQTRDRGSSRQGQVRERLPPTMFLERQQRLNPPVRCLPVASAGLVGRAQSLLAALASLPLPPHVSERCAPPLIDFFFFRGVFHIAALAAVEPLRHSPCGSGRLVVQDLKPVAPCLRAFAPIYPPRPCHFFLLLFFLLLLPLGSVKTRT
jgi:hypothetical protein